MRGDFGRGRILVAKLDVWYSMEMWIYKIWRKMIVSLLAGGGKTKCTGVIGG